MSSPLELLLSEGIIDEVHGRLKSGKEADVFYVSYRGNVVAAKVYKDQKQRSFKHNSAYKEGRKVRNSRTQRAIDKGSRYGRDEAEDAWKSSEANTLQILHRQGVRVPTPVLFYEGVLLMELVTDDEGELAPRLIEAAITPEQAGALYRDLRTQIVKILCCELIHGDLSPYNVLLGRTGPTIIDFPQSISAAHNTQSESFFHRDFANILNFFAAIDRRLLVHGGDAAAIWRAYTRRDLSPDFVPMPAPRPPPPPRHQGHGQSRGPSVQARPPQGAQHQQRPQGNQHQQPQGNQQQRSSNPQQQRSQNPQQQRSQNPLPQRSPNPQQQRSQNPQSQRSQNPLPQRSQNPLPQRSQSPQQRARVAQQRQPVVEYRSRVARPVNEPEESS